MTPDPLSLPNYNLPVLCSFICGLDHHIITTFIFQPHKGLSQVGDVVCAHKTGLIPSLFSNPSNQTRKFWL